MNLEVLPQARANLKRSVEVERAAAAAQGAKVVVFIGGIALAM